MVKLRNENLQMLETPDLETLLKLFHIHEFKKGARNFFRQEKVQTIGLVIFSQVKVIISLQSDEKPR